MKILRLRLATRQSRWCTVQIRRRSRRSLTFLSEVLWRRIWRKCVRRRPFRRKGAPLHSGSPMRITVIEMVRRLPTARTVFPFAKIVNVVDGVCEIRTKERSVLLSAGSAVAVGAGRWCQLVPKPEVRAWTVYADDALWRRQMECFLPIKQRLVPGLHPDDWDGTPLVLHVGEERLHALEPIWRQLSLLDTNRQPLELVTARTIELVARWVAEVVPVFLAPDARSEGLVDAWHPVDGRLTDPVLVGHIGKAVRVLCARLAEPWTVSSLAREVALSRTHLTRLFARYAGAPPMRFLTEVRVTEFTRLIEETDMSLACASQAVGWSDPRVASRWFRQRFGVTPSQYRTALSMHVESSAASLNSAVG